MTMDWSKPIEAVHEDGRTVAMKVAQLNAGAYADNDHWLATSDGSRFPGAPGSGWGNWARKDGQLNGQPGWRIRNVQPDGTLEIQGTPDPQYPPEVVERMVALVRQYAADDSAVVQRADGEYRSPCAEARAVATELYDRLGYTGAVYYLDDRLMGEDDDARAAAVQALLAEVEAIQIERIP